MKLPFVSRERYEEKVQELKELKDERQRLIDRGLIAAGQKPLYNQPENATLASMEALVSAGIMPQGKSLQGKPRLTLASVTKMGTEQAAAIARTPGAESVTAQMHKAQSRAIENARRRLAPMPEPPPPIPQKSEDHANAS